MRKFIFLLFLITSIFSLSSCSNEATEPTLPPNEQDNCTETAIPTEEPLVVLDYAEIILNSDFYNEKEVVVAGRIADFSRTSDNEFDFRDRLGFKEAGNGFTVHLAQTFSYKESVCDYYSVDEYVLVKGTWHKGYYSCLNDAVVLSTGDEAKAHSDIFMERWEAKGKSCAKTLPITDYMDIANNPEAFDGQRIRTVGKIQAIGTNVVTYYVYFSFRDRETNDTCISFSLKGCPQEMQNLCSEDQYVVISGVVQDDTGIPSVSDCFVECVGEQAELLANQSETTWLQNYQELRTNYISTCAEYSYEELARFPEKYTGNHIIISGHVLQTDTVWGENVVLLDVGQGDLVYISYTGKQYRDPEILQDDEIVFYGECSGTKTYTTVLGNNNTIPLIIAMYSSINQQ